MDESTLARLKDLGKWPRAKDKWCTGFWIVLSEIEQADLITFIDREVLRARLDERDKVGATYDLPRKQAILIQLNDDRREELQRQLDALEKEAPCP